MSSSPTNFTKFQSLSNVHLHKLKDMRFRCFQLFVHLNFPGCLSFCWSVCEFTSFEKDLIKMLINIKKRNVLKDKVFIMCTSPIEEQLHYSSLVQWTCKHLRVVSVFITFGPLGSGTHHVNACFVHVTATFLVKRGKSKWAIRFELWTDM